MVNMPAGCVSGATLATERLSYITCVIWRDGNEPHPGEKAAGFSDCAYIGQLDAAHNGHL